MKDTEVVMICANTNCGCGSFDMPGGSIWLLQLEVPGDQLTINNGEEFSVSIAPQKYFWLCPDCSRRFVLWRWTEAGVSLAERRLNARYGNEGEDASDPSPFSVHASVQVEEEYLDVG